MNKPPATARPARSTAARSPSGEVRTAAGSSAKFVGAAPNITMPRSSAKTPSSRAPANVVRSTILPHAINAASAEPMPMATENSAR